MAYRLHLVFDDPDSFLKEFEHNIAMGGAFLPTADPLELRSFVDVEFVLSYCDESVILEAEVVHLIPPERALNPGDVGVAVSFRKPASELREMFKPYLGEEAAEPTQTGETPDERADEDPDSLADLPMEKPCSSAHYPPNTRFDVVPHGITPSLHSDLEASVLELAGTGFEVARMLEIIPEQPIDVYRTVEKLIGRDVLKIADPTEGP
jgi:hypothetical protein